MKNTTFAILSLISLILPISASAYSLPYSYGYGGYGSSYYTLVGQSPYSMGGVPSTLYGGPGIGTPTYYPTGGQYYQQPYSTYSNYGMNYGMGYGGCGYSCNSSFGSWNGNPMTYPNTAVYPIFYSPTWPPYFGYLNGAPSIGF